MSYRILDRENGVASCRMAEIPERIKEDIVKQGGELSNLTFYFDKEQDLVVLNENHGYYALYEELVTVLMNCTDTELIELHASLPDGTREALENVLKILITVKKYRVLKMAAVTRPNQAVKTGI